MIIVVCKLYLEYLDPALVITIARNAEVQTMGSDLVVEMPKLSVQALRAKWEPARRTTDSMAALKAANGYSCRERVLVRPSRNLTPSQFVAELKQLVCLGSWIRFPGLVPLRHWTRSDCILKLMKTGKIK